MATRKKKTTVAKAEIVQEVVNWPKVTVGSHLMVTEYEDGRTTLVWDDDALLAEVRAALASVPNTESAPRRRKAAKSK